MSTYKPHGLAHDALDIIALSGCSQADIRRAMALPRAKRTKCNAILENMRADGLVSRRSDGLFYLTRLGEEVRLHLATGHAVPVEYGVILMEAA